MVWCGWACCGPPQKTKTEADSFAALRNDKQKINSNDNSKGEMRGLSTARQLETGFGFGGHVVDYCFQVAGFAEDFELAVGAGALVKHGVDVGDLFAAA